MGSDKPDVIRRLFFDNWDEATKSLKRSVMTLEDVVEAIHVCNEVDGLSRSGRNPANFLKDVIRKRNASTNWPQDISALGYTAVQRTGGKNAFEFVLFADGQEEPFPDLYRPNDATPRVSLQSISLPVASRKLGRADEAWLVQTAVNLRIVEQHLAVNSVVDILQLTHLQMSVKLKATEIDAIYLALLADGRSALVTCEAKKHSERILVDQIARQVEAAFANPDISLVIPVALRAVKDIGIHMLEFEAVSREELHKFATPSLASEAIYRLTPPVRGI